MKKVLIAEDNPITRKSLHAILTKAGHDVQVAEDGAHAFELVQQQPPQVVVTDWNMPRMSGLELCRAIRNLYPPHELYLLVATARDSRDDTLEAMQAGADDFLTKPVDPTELLARIHQAEIAQSRYRNQAALAESDPLTGLKNRRVFSDAVEREFARANRYELPLAAVMIDIDFFKQVNDQCGHSKGDELLCEVADALQQNARTTDYVVRIGGDEFALLLPNTTCEGALWLLNRVRTQISELRIPALGQDPRLTISAGVAAFRTGMSSAAQLVDHADQALLAAKRAGRDRVVTFEDAHDEPPEHTSAHRLAGDLIAADIMTVPLICLRQNEPLYRALEVFLELRIDSAPVLNDSGKLTGILTETDLLDYALSGETWNAPIEKIASVSLITFSEQVSVLDICRAFQRHGLRRAMIVRDGVPVGLVTQDALLRLLANWTHGVVTQHAEAVSTSDHGKKPDVCAIADAITRDMSRLKHDASSSRSELMPALVATATRVQQQAQKLLALSQDHANSFRQD